MANGFVNYINNNPTADGVLRDYQHASRLYVDNFYEFTPKAGWIYYTVLNINPNIRNSINQNKLKEFDAWYNRYKGSIGLLTKQVDLPKFSVETETLNQYNRKTIIQKTIKYQSVSLTFHDDMANSITNLWKNYFQYYIADSVDQRSFTLAPEIVPKYNDTKYIDNADAGSLNYGLNNNQSVPFFTSIDVFQLHKKQFTSFKLVNPVIREWTHDTLDQTVGNKMLTNKMTVEYETVLYNTDPTNKITQENPGFVLTHYDNTPSPLSVGAKNLVAPIPDSYEVLGNAPQQNQTNALDVLNFAVNAAILARNFSTMSNARKRGVGYSMLNSLLFNTTPQTTTVQNLDGSYSQVPAQGSIMTELNRDFAGLSRQAAPGSVPIGINLFTGRNSSVDNITYAAINKFGGY